MTHRTSFLVLLAVGSALAAEYPHAFPRTGVTKIFENDRITVWDVHWLKNTPQPIHRHRYDMAGVYLRFGPIRVTSPDGTAPPISPEFPAPRAYFQKAGITHKEEAVGGPDAPERWAIMVDLKYSSPAGKSTPDRPGDKNVLENDRIRMWDHTWNPGQPVVTPALTHDVVEVFLADGVLQVKGERVPVKQGTARIIQKGQAIDEQALNTPVHAILIDLNQ